MLKIAISIHDSFNEQSIETLHQAGILFRVSNNHYPIARSRDFPAELLFMPRNEIIMAVTAGVAHIGIVGEHHLLQEALEVDVVYQFSHERHNLSLLIPKDTKYKGIDWFTGKKIATPYPELLQNFLKKNKIRAHSWLKDHNITHVMDLGIADAFCDIVCSETFLLERQLREVEVLMSSSPVIVANRSVAIQEKVILDELIVRLDAVRAANGRKMLCMVVPNIHKEEVLALLMAEKKTVIIPFEGKGKSLFHVCLDESRLWDINSRLKQLNVESICVVALEKFIP
jgi:ATP phosphoribosyltransferase